MCTVLKDDLAPAKPTAEPDPVKDSAHVLADNVPVAGASVRASDVFGVWDPMCRCISCRAAIAASHGDREVEL